MARSGGPPKCYEGSEREEIQRHFPLAAIDVSEYETAIKAGLDTELGRPNVQIALQADYDCEGETGCPELGDLEALQQSRERPSAVLIPPEPEPRSDGHASQPFGRYQIPSGQYALERWPERKHHHHRATDDLGSRDDLSKPVRHLTSVLAPLTDRSVAMVAY
jgi:hypothetical protein